MPFILHKKLFLILIPAFIVAVVVGTLHHETGHYLAAKSLGLTASIHYDYTNVRAANEGEHATMKQMAFFVMAGPLQTMLTGTFALVLLYVLNKQGKLGNIRRYVLVFVALFWVRQPINLVLGLFKFTITRHFPERGDESKLSLYYHLPVWSLNAVTGIIGALVCVIIIFRLVPVTHRFTFWLASTIGGAIGYFFWIIWLGKYILP